MLWLILNSCDVLCVWGPGARDTAAMPRQKINATFPLSTHFHTVILPPLSLHLISLFFLSFILLQKLASYRLFSWLGRPWLHWCCFHWAVGWKINEANKPENSISSLKCTTQTPKYTACSKYTPCPQKYLFWMEVYLYSLTLNLSHLFHQAHNYYHLQSHINMIIL